MTGSVSATIEALASTLHRVGETIADGLEHLPVGEMAAGNGLELGDLVGETVPGCSAGVGVCIAPCNV